MKRDTQHLHIGIEIISIHYSVAVSISADYGDESA